MSFKMNRTIESPGVEIREVDLSLHSSLPVGTSVFVNGFANSGPSNELMNITSIKEFEQVYGSPTNAAERYFYYTAKQVLNSKGKLLANRLPYGDTSSTDILYTALLYPVTGTDPISGATNPDAFDAFRGFDIGSPHLLVMTEDEYNKLKSGDINWNTCATSDIDPTGFDNLGNTSIIVVNKFQTSIDDDLAGYYLGLIDNSVVGDTTYDSLTSICYTSASNDDLNIGVYTFPNTVNSDTITIELTGEVTTDSISELLETAPGFDISTSSYNDTIVIGLFRLLETPDANNDEYLVPVLKESFTGSLNPHRTISPQGQPESFYIEDLIEKSSTYLDIFVNPNLANNVTIYSDQTVTKIRANNPELNGIGAQSGSDHDREIGDILSKLNKALYMAENIDQIPIDLVCDGGLSTIYTELRSSHKSDYDEDRYFDISELKDQNTGHNCSIAQDWLSVFNKFETFCSSTRKDCMFISDPLKHIFVQKDHKIIDDSTTDFSSDIYWPLKNLYSASGSSYAAGYGNWVKTDGKYWVPASGFVANVMCDLDAAKQPWYAPAGLNNGVITDITDLGVSPTQKQRDLLYRSSINPIVFFPGDGFVIWGQKTLQSKPSAFDRINVRRLFLVLEKATRKILRYFVFEPNTIFTRTRVTNTLDPIFEIAKQNEGVYDYMLVCDERNNTPYVIDNNELAVDIYLKPVRTAEYILVSFYATRTGQDFNELI